MRVSLANYCTSVLLARMSSRLVASELMKGSERKKEIDSLSLRKSYFFMYLRKAALGMTKMLHI